MVRFYCVSPIRLLSEKQRKKWVSAKPVIVARFLRFIRLLCRIRGFDISAHPRNTFLKNAAQLTGFGEARRRRALFETHPPSRPNKADRYYCVTAQPFLDKQKTKGRIATRRRRAFFFHIRPASRPTLCGVSEFQAHEPTPGHVVTMGAHLITIIEPNKVTAGVFPRSRAV